MSASTTLNQGEIAATQSTVPPRSATNLRIWPAVALLMVFWTCLWANHNVELSNAARFLSRLAAYGVLLLAFMGWWLTRSAITWRDRFLAVTVVIATGVATNLIADKSINWFGLFLGAFPYVFTAWTAWLLVARSFTLPVQRAGFCVAILLVFGYFALLRFDGLDAAQRGEFSWRWTPTKEQQFLVSHGASSKQPSAQVAPDTNPWTPQPGDCLEYRGPQRDGVISGIAIEADWTEHPPKLLWRQKIGPAWSGLIAVDGHIVTQEQRGDVEAVVCYDAATGNEIWAHQDPVRFEEGLSGAGPRGTPTFSDGRIYAFGAKGLLNCLAAESGAVVWSHDAAADAGVTPADMPQWGYSVSPLVVDGLVVVFAGGAQEKGILAYQAVDGKLAWTRASGKQSYSSPQLVTLDGQKQIVMHDNLALVGLNIPDGAVLWEFPSGSEMSLPMLQPHAVSADRLAISTEPGAALLDVKHEGNKWNVITVWTANNFRPGFSDFVIHNECLYGLDDGVLCCFDLETGKRLWKKGRLGHGQVLLLADQNLMLVSSDKGEIILVSADREGYKELGRFPAIDGKTWNGPVLAGGRLFLRNGEEIAAFDVKLQQAPTEKNKAAISDDTSAALR